MNEQRFEVHSHTEYSNIRLLDCINKPKDLVNRAIEIGLKDAIDKIFSNKSILKNGNGFNSRFFINYGIY